MLEFLGDAVLGIVAVTFIFYCLGADREKSIAPDQLHLLKSSIVKNDTIAFMAVRHGLHRHLRYMSTSLGKSVTQFLAVRPDATCARGHTPILAPLQGARLM